MIFNRSKTTPDPLPQKAHDVEVRSKVEYEQKPTAGSHAGRRGSIASMPVTTSKGFCSLRGRRQEDRLVCGMKLFEKDGVSIELHLVADGHGGAKVAEFLACELPATLQRLCEERADSLSVEFKPKAPWAAVLRDAFETCSSTWDAGAATHMDKRAGAVATLLLMNGRHGFIAHVGDGKVIISSGESFTTLTSDHRANDPRERCRIESRGGFVVNNRVRGVLAPSRAFGDILVRLNSDGTVNNEVIRPEPDLIAFDMKRPGFLIMGTDGLFDVVTEASVATAVSVFMASNADATSAARYLAEHAAKLTDDDVSVIVIMWP